MTEITDDFDVTRDESGFMTLIKPYSKLYKKITYTTPLTQIHNRIYEYDIKAANLTMLAGSGEIKQSDIDKLSKMPKQLREEAIGKMIRRDKSIYKIISKGIYSARHRLFMLNSIQDSDVVAIKNDAVFIAGKPLTKTSFNGIEFKVKNQYSMFICIDKTEFYYSRRSNTLHIKGVSDSVLDTEDHQNGMVRFFTDVFNLVSLDRKDALRKMLIKFNHDYKNMKLPHEYYRELNSDNLYRTKIELSGYGFNLTEIGEDMKHVINPTYNYMRYILPIIRMYV